MPIDPHRVQAVFLAAVRETVGSRALFLDRECGDDTELRQRVEMLLQAHDEPGSFLESRPAGFLATVDMPAERPIGEKLGTQIGPYKLLQQIGEGGMGTVYMAEQTHPVQRKVAVKVIKAGMDSRQVIARFEAERQALAMMDHVNIARVLDAGATEAGRPYFVMELVHGVPITKYCDDNCLTPRQRLELFVPVCQAIQHAHQKGIIHRDIKPSNVMITLYDGRPVPKVIDFGVAKATEQKLTERTLFTQYGTMVGTLEYTSPEQAEMSALGVDTRSDIYSLGVLLYELLTGSTPLSRKRVQEAAYAEVLRMIRDEEPPRPSTRLSDSGEALASISALRHMEPAKLTKLVRGELDWIVMKTLEKDRNRRYETANAFAADVQRYLNDETVLACPPSAIYRFRKFARRNKAALATAAVVVSALCIATIGLAISNVLVRAERNEKIEALDEKGKALGEKQAALVEKQAALVDKEVALTQAQANYVEAKRQEGLAQINADNAKLQQQVAQQQEVLARRRFYAAQMNLAMQAWEAGHPARMLQLLESQRPRFDQDDLRGFDWYYLWGLCQGAYRFSLPTLNYDDASAIAISPDGKSLASGYGHTVRLWDVSTGRQSGEFVGHDNLVGWLAFAPDGKTLASSDETETVKLWDLATGKKRATLRPGHVVKGVQFAGDSRTLVLGGTRVKLWDVVANREVATLGESDKAFLSCYFAIARDGTAVAASGDSEVRIWVRDGSDWHEAPRLAGVGYRAPLAISPDGKLLAIGYNQLRLFDLPSGQVRTALQGHTGVVHAIAFAGEGNRLVSGGHDRTVRMWDVATGKQQACAANPGPVYGLALTPDASILAAMGTDAIRVWDNAPPIPATVLRHAAPVRALAYSPGGKTLASNGMDGTKLWDPADGREIMSLPTGTNSWCCGLAFSPDGSSLATMGAAKGTVDLWDITGRRLGVLKGTGNGLAYSPDGKLLAVTSDHGNAAVWDVASQRLRHSMPVSKFATSVAFSPDGRTIAAGGLFGVVKLFDAESGQEVNTLQRFEVAVDYAYTLAFSPDGRKLATGNQHGVVHIWDLATNQLDGSLIGHTDIIQSLAFADGGKTLATASHDRTIRLWDVATGQERIALKGHGGEVTGVAFAPGGNVLATSSLDGTVRLWRAAADANARARKREMDPDDEQSPVAHNELGDRLWEYDRTGEAETAYRQALERLEKLRSAFSDDPAYLQEMVRSLLSLSLLLRIERDHHPDAEPARLRAREAYRNLSPQHQEALFFDYQERNRKLYTGGNARQSHRVYSQLIELMPEDDAGWLTQATNHLAHCADARLRDPDRAIALARQAVVLWEKRVNDFPANPEFRLQLAHILRDTGNLDGALTNLNAAVEIAAGATSDLTYRLAEEISQLARLLRDKQRLGDAERLYRQAIALREPVCEAPPETRMAQANDYNDLAFTLKPAQRLPEAEQAVRAGLALKQTLVSEFPASGDYRTHLAHSYLGLGYIVEVSGRMSDTMQAFTEAANILNKLAAEAPGTESLARWQGDTLMQLGDTWLDRNRFEDAEQAHQKALKRFEELAADYPANGYYRQQQGFSHRKLADVATRAGRTKDSERHLREAIGCFNQAITQAPRDVPLRILRAHLLRDTGDLEQALLQFSEVLAVAPQESDAWTGRAFVHFHRQQWDAAIADYSRAIDLAPQVHTNWWHRGLSYLALAQWDQAAEDFGKVAEQWPEQAEAWYWRGVAFAQLNQPDKALADLRQAITKGFNNLAQMKNDSRLATLRIREDFGKLLEEMERKEKSQSK